MLSDHSPIGASSKPFSFSRIAGSCRALRSRWGQEGISFTAVTLTLLLDFLAAALVLVPTYATRSAAKHFVAWRFAIASRIACHSWPSGGLKAYRLVAS
jgi:hypothetical protein